MTILVLGMAVLLFVNQRTLPFGPALVIVVIVLVPAVVLDVLILIGPRARPPGDPLSHHRPRERRPPKRS